MLKTLIEQAKLRAENDDIKYWQRQEEFLQRKEITIRDFKFSHIFFIFSLSFLFSTLIISYFI